MKKILSIIAIIFILWFIFAPPPKANWRGQLVPDDPVQTSEALPAPWVKGKYTYTPRAHYEIKAVVLSKHFYWAGSDVDDIAPYDLALGWGVMSDAANINALRISQRGRWFNYSRRKTSTLRTEEINLHSSNNHIVASDRKILNEIASLRRFDVVLLKGYLVDITRPDGWRWQTSLVREDIIGGACELFWVEHVEKTKAPR